MVSPDFRWLCVLNCFSGKPVTGNIKNMIFLEVVTFLATLLGPWHITKALTFVSL